MRNLDYGITNALALGLIFSLIAIPTTGLSLGNVIVILSFGVLLLASVFTHLAKKETPLKINNRINFLFALIFGTIVSLYTIHLRGISVGDGSGLEFLWIIQYTVIIFIVGIVITFTKISNSNENEFDLEKKPTSKIQILIFIFALLALVLAYPYVGSENCVYISEQYKNGNPCFRAYVNNEGDVSLCDKTRDLEWRNICYIRLSKSTDDHSICGKITFSQEYKEACYENHLGEGNTLDLCNNLNEPKNKEKCYYYYAVSSEDSSYCEKASSDGARSHTISSCYSKIASSTGEISLCEKTRFPNQCYPSVALKREDPSICENSEFSDEKYWCRAMITKDISDCDMIKDDSPYTLVWNRASCYANLATIKNDKSICDKLLIPEDIEKCKRQAN